MLKAVVLLAGLAVFIGLFTLGAHPPQPAIDPALTQGLPPTIRHMGFRCQTLSQISLEAKTERGDVFYVLCDAATDRYAYRLTANDHRWVVRPWSE